MEYIDLHTHSTCSDGSLTPTELVKEARLAGLAAIALTDHDTMAGIAEALSAGQKTGLEVISGVEASASHQGRPVHILGYGLDQSDRDLTLLLAELQRIRRDRNDRIIEKLAGQGLIINREELAATASGLIGRPHIARILVRQRAVFSIDHAFRKYLGKTGRTYVESARFPAEDVIRTITGAGGLAVLAHPATFAASPEQIATLVRDLKARGLGGIEAYYPGHPTNLCKQLLDLAGKLDLAVTGGSDFHGSVKPGIHIGGAPVMPPVPYRFLENLRERLAGRH